MFGVNRAEAEESISRCLEYSKMEIQDRGIDIQGMYNMDLYRHCEHVAQLGIILAQAYGFNLHDLVQIGIGGYLHDIGKCEVADKIVNRSGELNAEERMLAQSHPSIGYRVLSTYGFTQDVMNMVLYHHERLDGSGYPTGRSDIDIRVQLISLADAFDTAYGKKTADESALMILEREPGLNRVAIDILRRIQNGDGN